MPQPFIFQVNTPQANRTPCYNKDQQRRSQRGTVTLNQTDADPQLRGERKDAAG